MKRHELLEHLRQHGCALVREGRRHSWWGNAANGRRSAFGNPGPAVPQDLPGSRHPAALRVEVLKTKDNSVSLHFSPALGEKTNRDYLVLLDFSPTAGEK